MPHARLTAFVALPLLALSLLAPIRPALCQAAAPSSASLAPLLSGSQYPLTLTLKDLNANWRTFTLGASGGDMSIYISLLTGSQQNIYYTQGQTVTGGGEVYLIAYHLQSTPNYAALLRGGSSSLPPAPKLTSDTVLSLSLLNLHSTGSLSDIHPFLLQDALNPSPAVAALTEESLATSSESNLKQIGLGVIQYTQDYDEKLPPMKSAAVAKAVLMPYIKSDDVFVQPKTKKPYLPNTSLSHRTLASFSDPATMVIYYEADPMADGKRAVLFLDGHVSRVEESEWQRLKAASHVPNPPPGVQ